MTEACTRLWEVEAARDGRLAGDALVEHLAHRACCAECGRAAASLDALRDDLLASRRPAPSEAELDRLRHRLLARSDAQQTTASRRRGPWVVVAVAAALVGAVGVHVVRKPASAIATRLPFVVEPNPTARFDTRLEAGVHRITLTEGAIRVRITRQPSDPTVLVFVPDGVIEDRGTQFAVQASPVATLGIQVDDGEVVFRRKDGAVFLLGAGQRFPMPVAAVITTTSVAAVQPAAPPKSVASIVPVAPSPSAVELSAEDVAYLRILRLLKEGRKEESRAAARTYLASFPNGFRRAEVEALAK